MQTNNLLVINLLVCIAIAGVTLYLLTEKQNALIELRIAIPTLTQEVQQLQEENLRLRYEVDRFENPIHLMKISRQPEYGHLKFPYLQEVISLKEKERENVED